MSSTSNSPVQAVIGLSGFPSQWGGLHTTQERFTRLDLPDAIGPEHVASLRAECERLADLAGRHPQTLAVLQNAVLQGDQRATDWAIDELGLRPPPADSFQGHSLAVAGGILLVLVVAALVIGGGGDTQMAPVGPEGGVPRTDPGDAGDAGDAGNAGAR